MKKYANDLVPGDVFHPAEFIKDEMEAQNIKQADLARISGFNRSFGSLLLKGERSITRNKIGTRFPESLVISFFCNCFIPVFPLKAASNPYLFSGSLCHQLAQYT